MEKTTVTITITVEVDGRSKTFTASAETGGSAFSAALGLLNAVRSDASGWVINQENTKQEAAREQQRAERRVPTGHGLNLTMLLPDGDQ